MQFKQPITRINVGNVHFFYAQFFILCCHDGVLKARLGWLGLEKDHVLAHLILSPLRRLQIVVISQDSIWSPLRWPAHLPTQSVGIWQPGYEAHHLTHCTFKRRKQKILCSPKKVRLSSPQPLIFVQSPSVQYNLIKMNI